MSFQDYYEIDNGLYCVIFLNKSGLSIDEITELFSEFGDVAAVTKAGDDYGYRFVRYRTEEEVLRCIEALQNHQTIRLKIPRKKNRNGNGPSANANHQQKPQFNPTSAADRIRRNFDNQSHAAINNKPTADAINCPRGESHNGRDLTKHDRDFEKCEKLSEQRAYRLQCVNNSTPLRQPEVAAHTYMTINDRKSFTNDVGNCSAKSDNRSSGVETIMKSKVKNDKIVESNESCQKMPRLVNISSVSSTDKNNEGSKSMEGGSDTVTAQQVVVANIHSDYGVHYVLHLIEKHNPLCVSPMKIVPSLGLRYCVVYLPSLQQAHAIEKEFDNFKLCEKNLIVMRPQRLAKLGTVV